jgi:hypothetical protein
MVLIAFIEGECHGADTFLLRGSVVVPIPFIEGECHGADTFY